MNLCKTPRKCVETHFRGVSHRRRPQQAYFKISLK